MWFALALCIVSVAPAGEVRAKVPGSSVEIALRLDGFRPSEENSIVIGAFEKKPLLVGFLGGLGVMVSVKSESDYSHRGSEECRKHFLEERAADPTGGPYPMVGKPELFDADGIACAEYVLEGSRELGPKKEQVDFRQVNRAAFPVAWGFRFVLHVSTMGPGDPKEERFTRESFLEIVRSFRAGLFRRGSFDDFPAEVNEFLHRAGLRTPEEIAWVDGESKARPGDFVPPFVLGEAALTRKIPDLAAKAYARATELLRKRKEPQSAERFVLALAEEGWGLELSRAGKPSEALPHLRAAYDLAADRSDLRGPLAYELAGAHAAKLDAPNAAKFLKEAASLDAKYGPMARLDRAFDKVRKKKEFAETLAKLPAEAPK